MYIRTIRLVDRLLAQCTHQFVHFKSPTIILQLNTMLCRYKDKIKKHHVNVCESTPGNVAYKNTVNCGERKEDSGFYKETIIQELVSECPQREDGRQVG